MCTETLQASKQPDETPDVQPCHTGKKALTCGRCRSLLEQDLGIEGTCISCGAPYGQGHYSHCKFQTFRGAA